MSSRVSPAGSCRGRLTLLPGLCRLWRDETAVQLGANPSRAIIIDLPDPKAARVLDLLDGSRNERAVLRDAGALGVPRDVTAAMLAALRAANVVVGTDTLMPSSMPEGVRRRLVTEAAAIAMAARTLDIPALESETPSATGSRATVSSGLDLPRGDLTVASGDLDVASGDLDVKDGDLEPARGWENDADAGRKDVARGDADPSRQPPVTERSRHSVMATSQIVKQVTPAEVIRRRAAASVQVTGASRLVVPIASTLARAGVGHVDPAISGRVGVHDDAIGGITPADTNRPRGTAASEAVLRAAPFTDTRAMRVGGASFVVQVGQGVPAELAAHAYARKSLAHLLIEERDDTVLIGPLVPPDGSPCLRCLDLHRRDRDPAWPMLVAQLATSGDAAPSVSTATTVIAVGVAVAQVLAYLDGDDAETIGASIEVGTPSTLRRRSWEAHPRCDCAYRTRHRRRARAS